MRGLRFLWESWAMIRFCPLWESSANCFVSCLWEIATGARATSFRTGGRWNSSRNKTRVIGESPSAMPFCRQGAILLIMVHAGSKPNRLKTMMVTLVSTANPCTFMVCYFLTNNCASAYQAITSEQLARGFLTTSHQWCVLRPFWREISTTHWKQSDNKFFKVKKQEEALS